MLRAVLKHEPEMVMISDLPDANTARAAAQAALGGRLVFAETFPDPDRLSVRQLCDLAEPENFEFVEATGNWWCDVVSFRNRGS